MPQPLLLQPLNPSTHLLSFLSSSEGSDPALYYSLNQGHLCLCIVTANEGTGMYELLFFTYSWSIKQKRKLKHYYIKKKMSSAFHNPSSIFQSGKKG